MSGILTQAFSSTYNGQTATLSVDLNLLEVDGMTWLPPSEDRVLVVPGSSTDMAFGLRNTGTSNLTLLPTLSGLPANVDASFDVQNVELTRNTEQGIVITFTAATGATPATTSVTLTYQDGAFSTSYTFDVVVVDRQEVMVNSVQQRLFASPLAESTMTVEVTNLGTASDVYAVEWSTESSGSWFEFTISPTTFQLEAGASQQITLGVREISIGAPDNGVIYTLRLVSTSDEAVSDSLNITVEPVVAAPHLTVEVEKSTAKPGESVYGTVQITNHGNTEDTFT